MSIGKWIVVAFVLFAGFIGTLVTVCVKQDVNLVSKDYYKEELAYQDQVVRINNTKSLERKPTVHVIDGSVIEVRFNGDDTITKGTMKLFCPSNPDMDRDFDLVPLAENSRKVEISSLKKGMYRAKIYWTSDSKEFYHEEVINL
jgi:hypothetical protein